MRALTVAVMNDRDIDNIVNSIKSTWTTTSPKRVSVPTPEEATEDEAIRSVQKQFETAGFDCPEDTARELVQAAYEQHRQQDG